MIKIFFLLINCLFINNCAPNKAKHNNNSNSNSNNSSLVDGITKVAVKDKTSPPGLRVNVPDNAAKDGWAITQNNLVDLPTKYDDTKPNMIILTAKKNNKTINIVFGSITKEKDTIVNAANTTLEGGGGIDGAIHKAALVNKQDLLKQEGIEYKKFHKILSFITGSAMAMHAYGLHPHIKAIIFTAGPDLSSKNGINKPQDDLELYSSIYNSLDKAQEYGAESVSIPAISSAIFAFPLDKAGPIYFKAILEFFKDHPNSCIKNINFIEIGRDKLLFIANKFLEILL